MWVPEKLCKFLDRLAKSVCTNKICLDTVVLKKAFVRQYFKFSHFIVLKHPAKVKYSFTFYCYVETQFIS